ncbi:MAG: hypothetical protein ACT6R2_04735 [Blastomonas fulva]|uniref:hypothetical protein n=1 Tax=Blastomonas fulva TaxID=1550728 RepID=UPI004034712D
MKLLLTGFPGLRKAVAEWIARRNVGVMTGDNSKFAFLQKPKPLAFHPGVLAERSWADHPNGCLMKLSQLSGSPVNALDRASALRPGIPGSTESAGKAAVRCQISAQC